jgi:sulfate transport system ATP-binding protein
MSIELRNVSKTFGSFRALEDVSLHVQSGELVALLGPSGSGKTTLLRIIAGLEVADPGKGSILFDATEATHRSVRDRRVGFVFQHYALFRHMTVFDNVAFGLQVRPRKDRPSRQQIHDKVMELLGLVQLEPLAKRFPTQLSGGQRQRVALARALAVEPAVLLLDEPFGALDAQVRKELRRWLRRLHDEIHITSVFVTHDQEEALEVADRVAIMNEGRVEQIGTPQEVYDQPANPFIFNFLGNVNLFHGRVDQGRAQLGGLDVEAPEHAGTRDTAAVGYVRPHEIELERHRNGETAIEAIVRYVYAVGPTARLELERRDTGEMIEAELTRERHRELELQVGERVFVRPKDVRIFVDDYSI